MKIAILDITSRNAEQYNPSLCKALAKINTNGKVYLLSTNLYKKPEGYVFKQLISLIPKKWKRSASKSKRIGRFAESFLNYIYLILFTTICKLDVLHIQWLPFIDYCRIEKLFLITLHFLNPHLKIFLTVHNIYPHTTSVKSKERYYKNFHDVKRFVDGFIVHLNSAKKELSEEFDISEKKIYVAYHGIYVPDEYDVQNINKVKDIKNIILFGHQTKYKGADVLINALALLPEEYLNKLHVRILGQTAEEIYNNNIKEAKRLNVEWVNEFVPNKDLYQAIGESDLILLPYRNISQSGVLLLALSYKKPILTSDLPSFRETLEGYPRDYFFKPDNPKSLAEMLKRYVDGDINEEYLKEKIIKLNFKYSWSESARNTLAAYFQVAKEN